MLISKDKKSIIIKSILNIDGLNKWLELPKGYFMAILLPLILIYRRFSTNLRYVDLNLLFFLSIRSTKKDKLYF